MPSEILVDIFCRRISCDSSDSISAEIIKGLTCSNHKIFFLFDLVTANYISIGF